MEGDGKHLGSGSVWGRLGMQKGGFWVVVGGKDLVTRVLERDGAAEAGASRHFSLSVFCFLFSLFFACFVGSLDDGVQSREGGVDMRRNLSIYLIYQFISYLNGFI